MDRRLLPREQQILSNLDLEFVGYLKKGNVFNTLKCLDSKKKPIVIKYLKNNILNAELENEKRILLNSSNNHYLNYFQMISSGSDYIATSFVDGKIFSTEKAVLDFDKYIINLLVKAIIEFQNIDVAKLGLRKQNSFFFHQITKNIIKLYPEFLNSKDLAIIVFLIAKNVFNIFKYKRISHNDLSGVNIIIDNKNVYFLDFSKLSASNFMFYDPCFLCFHGLVRVENWNWQNEFLSSYLTEIKKGLKTELPKATIKEMFRIGLIAAALTRCCVILEIEGVIPTHKTKIRKIGLIKKLKHNEQKSIVSQRTKVTQHNLAFLLNNDKFNRWFNRVMNNLH